MSDCPFKVNACFIYCLEYISGYLASSIRCARKYQEVCVLAPNVKV